MKEIKLRTGIWYNDRAITLSFPDSWEVVTYWPNTPPPLTDEDISKIADSPIGQPPLYELAKGKKNPLIVVDDLARPTPTYRIVPLLLHHLERAGITSSRVRILVATGTHGEQNESALANKLGKAGIESCNVIVHNDMCNTKYIGRTSFGTPVFANKELLSSDLIIGISGVYPQHTTGFGGGSKLSLGVLGRKSIIHLHYGHEAVGGNYDINNGFRRDVTEIARMIKLNTIYTIHVNAHLEIVNLMCGDHFSYYPRAAQFSLEKYAAPLPDEADVVIANAYPFDLSFTFMRKAYKPLDYAPQKATKIMVASNSEGIGVHGLFQHIKPSRFIRYRSMYRRISLMEPRVILSKLINRLKFRKELQSNEHKAAPNYAMPRNTNHLWVYRPNCEDLRTPAIDGMTTTDAWKNILEAIEKEQSHGNAIKVRIYPCAPLQCLVRN